MGDDLEYILVFYGHWHSLACDHITLIYAFIFIFSSPFCLFLIHTTKCRDRSHVCVCVCVCVFVCVCVCLCVCVCILRRTDTYIYLESHRHYYLSLVSFTETKNMYSYVQSLSKDNFLMYDLHLLKVEFRHQWTIKQTTNRCDGVLC